MLKKLNTKSIDSKKGVDGVDGSRKKYGNRVELVSSNEVGSNKVDNEVWKNQKTFKFRKSSKSKKMIGSSDFFTLRAKLAFTKLRQAFVKVLTLHYFDLKHHIQIEMDI